MTTDVGLDSGPQRPWLSRRAALLGAGSAFVAALATLASSKEVLADCQGSPCCSLASCTRCTVQQCSGWFCPVGYHQTCWNCRSGGSWYMCGECSAGSTCYQGPTRARSGRGRRLPAARTSRGSKSAREHQEADGRRG